MIKRYSKARLKKEAQEAALNSAWPVSSFTAGALWLADWLALLEEDTISITPPKEANGQYLDK